MPKFKLVSNVSEFGLFHSLAKTRARLIASTALITAVSIGAGVVSAHYVLEKSSSVSLNMLLITINMAIVLVAAYAQALLVGDIFFSGPWREQVVLGDKTYKNDVDADIVVHDHNAEFMIVLLLLIVGNAIGLNIAAGGFLDTYHTEGFFRVRMRSEQPQERLQVLKDMVEPTQSDLWEIPGVQKVVINGLKDPAPTVRAQAAWNIGKMKAVSARSALIEMMDKDDSVTVRAEAATALGRLGQNVTARDALILKIKTASPQVLVGIVRGLGMMNDKESSTALLGLITHKEKDVWLNTFWALRQLRSAKARPIIKKELSQPNLDPIRKCALLDTMKMVSTEEDVIWARKRYLRAEKETKCKPVIWEDRDERQRYILLYDRMRTKYIKIVANSGGAGKQKSWFQRIASDPSEPWPVREVAGQVLKQLK